MEDKVKKQYETMLTCLRETVISNKTMSGSCSCCGLYTGFSEYPRGIEVVVDDVVVPKFSTSDYVTYQSVQLNNGKWLSIQMFTPTRKFISLEEYPQEHKDNTPVYKDLNSLVICHLSGYNIDEIKLYEGLGKLNTYKFPTNPLQTVLGENKDKQFIAINTKEYGDWITKKKLNDFLEIEWESEWFCNRPYLNDYDEINRLQLQIVKVK